MDVLRRKKKSIRELFSILDDLKRNRGLIIHDTHVHPLDVMGLVKGDEYNIGHNNLAGVDFSRSTLPEILKQGSLANLLLRLAFRFFPSTVKKSVAGLYANSGPERILREMDFNDVDKAVLVPIEPWARTKNIFKQFNHARFILFGSIDIHRISLDNLDKELDYQVNHYQIEGIKLHPNLQGFFPQPSKNTPETREKLKLIYRFAERNGLPILFHGGLTNFTDYLATNSDIDTQELKGVARLRRARNSLLEEFCQPDGRSEIFENYQMPVIIAHLGNYALIKPNFNLLGIIAKRYPNVLFNTSGVSPTIIKRGIETVGSQKIIFGSDSPYNTIYSSLRFCVIAILQSDTKETSEEKLLNILGFNFQKMMNLNSDK